MTKIPVEIPLVIPVVGPILFMVIWTYFTQWQDKEQQRLWRRATQLYVIMLVFIFYIQVRG